MSAADVLVAVLLAVGVGVELVCALGVLAMRGAYDRLHYAGAASFGAVFVAAAIVVREGLSLYTAQAVLTAAFLVLASPVLVHATGRAARLRERGDLRAQAHEVEEGS